MYGMLNIAVVWSLYLKYLDNSLQSLESMKDGNPKKYFTQLFSEENITVSATNGQEKIFGSDIFNERVYLDYVPIVNTMSTIETTVRIFEVVNDGTFADFFGSFGENRLRWKECQVVQFCREHRDKIRVGSYVTLFELEGCYVVGVLIDDDNRLRAYVRSVTNPTIWQAYYRRRLIILF